MYNYEQLLPVLARFLLFYPHGGTILRRMEKWNDSGMNMTNIDGVLKPLKNSSNGIITDYMVRYG